jgi:hypothetical protein
MAVSLFRLIKRHPLPAVLLFAVVAFAMSVRLFFNGGMMGLDWTFPYFSGAANFERLFDWQISPSDYHSAQHLAPSDYVRYRHLPTTGTVSYGLNSYGYVLVALLARSLFQGLGDVQSVIALQLVAHALIGVVFLVYIFAETKSRIAFVFLYVANPLVVYFATFPFYYFWLCIPSACCAALLLRPCWGRQILLIATPLMLISLLIRPTTFFLCLLVYVFAFRALPGRRLSIVLPALSIFMAGVVVMSSLNPRLPPWHTMYVGLGAYANSSGVSRLSDDEGYRYFTDQTGVKISTSPVSGNWGQPVLMKSYGQVVRARYFHSLIAQPARVLANALLNFGQVFSVGYIVDNPALSLLSSLVGWCVAAYLLVRGQALWVLAIVASALSFFWYFPPIPAYNFAAYLLLACGLICSLTSRAPLPADRSRASRVS